MQTSTAIIVLIVGLAALGGCSSQPVQEIKRIFQSKGEPQLPAGIKNYEDGRYTQATANFQSALDAGLSTGDQVNGEQVSRVHQLRLGPRPTVPRVFQPRARARSGFRARACRGRPSDVGTRIPQRQERIAQALMR